MSQIRLTKSQFLHVYSLRYSVYFIILLIVTLLFTQNATAEVVWNYSFDNVDELNDWTMVDGNFSIADGELIVSDCVDITLNYGSFCFARMEQNSMDSVGKWSFDYFRSNPETSVLFIYFIAKGQSSFGPYPEEGNMLAIRVDDSMSFGYFSDIGESNRITYSYPNDKIDPYYGSQWLHIEFIRDSEGDMSFSFNSTEMASLNSDFNNGELISIAIAEGDKIDNLQLETFEGTLLPPDSPPGIDPVYYAIVGLGSITIGAVVYLTFRYFKKKELNL